MNDVCIWRFLVVINFAKASVFKPWEYVTYFSLPELYILHSSVLDLKSNIWWNAEDGIRWSEVKVEWDWVEL